jgi:poly(hydroxyalkanoate) depolymerase family esterase
MGQQVAGQLLKASAVPVRASPTAMPRARGQWLPGMALGPGGMRAYQLFVPDALGTQRPGVPLMVMLHGCDQSAAEFAHVTRMHTLGAQHGFLVLYLQQDRVHNVNGCWNWWDTQNGRAQAEAATLMQAIQQVSALHGVDRERIAVAGLSAGASMAALLAATYLDRFCAVAMHSGVAPGAAQSGLGALAAMRGHRREDVAVTAVGKARSAIDRRRQLPPLLVLQGQGDSVVLPSNGDQAAELWAHIAGAQRGRAQRLQRGKRKAWVQTDFEVGGQLCARLCEIEQLGHAWSGGTKRPYSDPAGPDASRMIWRFAQAAVQGTSVKP